MKRTIVAILLALILSSTAQAASYYFDLASGNDTTGDGSSGNPWKTIDKCTTSRSAGDECRGAKTAVTTLDGTLTFTNGSTSVATSSDLTAVVAAGDLVGKNSAGEGWWRVASLTSSVITLSYQFWSQTGSGDAATGYKMTPVTASEEYDLNSSGTVGSRIVVSGGWDLGTTTRNGYTAVLVGSGNNGIDLNQKTSVEISYFIFTCAANSNSAIFFNNNSDIYLHHFYSTSSGSTAHLRCYTSYSLKDILITDTILTGGTGTGIYLAQPISFLTIRDTVLYSVGTGSGDYGIFCYSELLQHALFDGVKVYNSYANNFFSDQGMTNVTFKDCKFHTLRSTQYSVFIGQAADRAVDKISFLNCEFDGTGGYEDFASRNVSNVYLKSCTGTITLHSSTPTWYGYGISNCATGSDCVSTCEAGTMTMDSGVNARSGKAVKLTPLSAGYPLMQIVGSVKIPSAASDLTLNAYIKEDGSLNGGTVFLVKRDGFILTWEKKSVTTSYVKNSVVVPSASLVAGEFLELYVLVYGTAGNLWIDDFSAEQ